MLTPYPDDHSTAPSPTTTPARESSPRASQTRNEDFYKLNILTALFMFLLDQMAGALELATGGLFWVVTLALGALAFPVCVLIERYVAHNSWGGAVARASVVSIVTAIPTGLPGWITLAWGVGSTLGPKHRHDASDTIDMH